jgi:F-type H+-transporting ATPase subunit epsilon
LVAEEADMVVAPGGDGDFGVLPGHAPLLSTLRPGTMDIYQDGKITQSFFVAGGFAEVSGERLTLLAEEAMPVAEIDRAAAEDRLKNAREAEAAADEDARKAAEAERITAEAMLAAADSAGKGRA